MKDASFFPRGFSAPLLEYVVCKTVKHCKRSVEDFVTMIPSDESLWQRSRGDNYFVNFYEIRVICINSSVAGGTCLPSTYPVSLRYNLNQCAIQVQGSSERLYTYSFQRSKTLQTLQEVLRYQSKM